MADGGGVDDSLVSEKEGVCEAEWLENTLAQSSLEGLARDHFDDATREHESAATVSPQLAWGAELAERIEAGDAAGEGVVTHAEVVVVVAEEAALVAQELTKRDRVAGAHIGELEVGQVDSDGSIEIESALVYECHDQSGGVDLRDGADGEEGVGADRVVSLEAGDAVYACLAFAITEHADNGARDSPAGHLFTDMGIEVWGYQARFGYHAGLFCRLG